MKNSTKKFSLIILGNLFGISLLFGQGDTSNTIGRVSISSPTAASLGKYGDIPVSYHTGIPQIDIPIYTVEAGSIKLPISLSYHASGLKVQENASWVGAGWSLNAGGVITRTVNGAPDDRGASSGTNVIKGHYIDNGYNSYLNTNPDNTGNPYDHDLTIGIKDGEPDLYFFNFGNYSGKFYFNDDRVPILVPEADFKIQTYYQLGSGFQGFIITTPDGAKYYFGKTGNYSGTDPIEITIPSTLQNGTSTANSSVSSWFLNKIVSADGMDSVNLKYQTETYSFYALSLFPILDVNYRPATGIPQNTGMDLAKNFVSGVRLTQILFPNGTINFTRSATPRVDLSAGIEAGSSMTDANNTTSYSLGSISISNNNGFCKKDSFYYGNFFDNSPLNSNFFNFFSTYNLHSDEYKLRLDSMSETSCDASLKVPAYKFTYFSEFVPRRLSFGVDHWGYSNGVTTNTLMVPTFTVVTSGVGTVVQGANRDAVWPAMRGGSLQQITYPTGGFTSFDFEPKNIFSFYSSTFQPVNLANYALNIFGQSQLTQTKNFTIDGNGGAYFVTVNNNATNYSVTLTVKNSGGANVAGSPITISNNSTYNYSIVLPAGTYTATLNFPNGSSPVGGAYGSIGQWQYVSTVNTQNVGGLRIKTILNNDGLTPNNITTSYSYVGAVLYGIPTYVQILRNDLMKLVWPYCTSNGCFSCDGFNAHTYYVSASNIRPMSSIQGENMGYNEVDVSQAGNGKSVYRYYGSNLWNLNISDVCNRVVNQSSSCDANIPNFPFPPVPFEFMRDEMSYEGHFNQSGQVLKESYYYPVYSLDPLKTPGHISVDLPGAFTFTEYNLQSARKISNKIIETQYDPSTGNSIASTNIVYYGSLFHNQPTRKVSFTSTGDSLQSNIKYAMDFRIASCDVIPDSLTYYNTLIHNDSLAMLTAVNTCTPQANDGTNCRWYAYTTYREQLVQARANFLRYRRNYFAVDTSNVQSRCYSAALTNADTLLKPVLRLQNLYQNPSIEQTSWKNLNLLHASFLRYDTSLSPVGFAYPGRNKLINLQAPSGSFTNSQVSGNTITKDSRYADETIATFGSGRPSQVLGKDGLTSSYLWDYLNTQPIAKISNATQADIAYSSFEADGKGNWSFAGPTATDATAPTGTKTYTLSGGNVTKSSLTSTTTYVVSYWSNGSSYSVTGSSSIKQGKTINMNGTNWTFYEHTVSGTTSVAVSGTGKIDELRLYPSNAQMTTYTYTPLLGMTASCDVDNRITYYFYDNLGRLKWIKDQDLNIIKTIQYHYQTITGSQY